MNIIAVSNNIYDNSELLKKDNFLILKDKSELNLENLKRINPDYIFFPHWSYIIPAEIYENFECVMFHMTDLPFGRGGSPLQNLLERGIYETQVSAFKCVKELDAGDIYIKKPFSIKEGTAKEIFLRGAQIVSEMIDEIVEKKPSPTHQKGEAVIFKRRTPDMSDISQLMTLEKIYDYIRMLDCEGYPRAFLELNNLRLEFDNAEYKDGKLIAKVEIRVKDETK